MVTTVTAAFAEFSARLEPTATQRTDASTKHNAVRDCLGEVLWLTRAFLTGSYARWTIIRPPNDIDLFVVLDGSKHAGDYFYAVGGAQAVLERFHSRLKYCYPDTAIRKDHPAVHMAFATIGLDVIPAFDRQGGGYFIPSHVGYGWIPTDPTKHAERTSAMNKATGNYFIPLVKMFKSWNRAHFDKLTGFHIEMALVNAWPRIRSSVIPFSDVAIVYAGFAPAAAALLQSLSDRLAYVTPDPAGLSGNIDDYLPAVDRQLTRDRLVSCAQTAQVALRHEARGDHYSAISRWRDIFGGDFPAYG